MLSLPELCSLGESSSIFSDLSGSITHFEFISSTIVLFLEPSEFIDLYVSDF